MRPDRRRFVCCALTGSIMSNPLRLLLGARGIRNFGDGFVAVLLPVYLMALGFSPLEVGALAGTALFGSALLTLAVGFLGVRYDHRLLLISSAGLMTATGVALSIVDSYALLLVVAFVGSVNPSGGSASSFVPVEHAVLTREAADAERTKTFARYSLVGGLASACGALTAAMPELFTRPNSSELCGIKAMFWIYALLGLVGGLLYTRIPGRMPLTQHDLAQALGPSRTIVYKLAALFSLDAFAGGFVVPVAFGSLVIRTDSICRFRLRACSSSGRGSSPLSLFPSQHRFRAGSGSSTPWSSHISPRTCALSSRLSRHRLPWRSACCSCGRRCRRWMCRRAPPM